MISREGRLVVIAALLVFPACEGDANPGSMIDVRLEERLSVGVLDGDDTEVFGLISDIRAAEDGSFFVLDEQSAIVSWFSADGEYLNGLRSQGEGPGELSGPRTIDISDGTLLVVDPPNARYSFFALGPGGIQYEESMQTLSSSINMGRHVCSVGERLFVWDVQEGLGIHEFDRQGQILQSFHEVDAAREEEFGRVTSLVTRQKNSGHFLCSRSPEMIVALDIYRPNIHAYSLDGELLWETQSEGFLAIDFVAADGGMRFESGPDGFHMGEAILRWTDESILVQRSRSWPVGTLQVDRNRDFFSVDSRILSLVDGTELARSDSLPFLVDGHDNRFYSFQNVPFPRVLIYDRK